MMRKIYKYRLLALAVGSAFVLSGCAVKEKGNPPINQINSVVQSGIDSNKAVAAEHSGTQVPGAINQALLPSLGIGNQGVQPVSEYFDVEVSNMPAQEFFMGLVKGTPYNIIVSPDVRGSISLNLKHVTIQQVLDAVHDMYGYHYQYTPYGFEVYPSGMQTRIFTVNYLDVERYGMSYTNVISGEITNDSSNSNGSSGSSGSSNNNSGSNSNSGQTSSGGLGSGQNGQQGDGSSSPSGISSSINTVSKTDFWKVLQKSLQTIVGKKSGATVMVNPLAGVVIVHAEPAQLHEIAQYLDDTQSSMNREVLIDTQILEVTLNKNYQAGVDWHALGLHVSALGSSVIGEGTSAAATTATNLPGNLAPFAQIFSLAGSADHGNFQGVIQALSTQGNVQSLSNPQISTMNNQEAVIKVGTDKYYTTGFSSNITDSGTSSDNLTTSQTVDVAPFFSGVALGVTPEIGANGEVTLHIHPLVSTVTSDPQNFSIGSQNGVPVTTSVNMAASQVSESDSIVRAKSGEVIVLGGLMLNNVDEEHGGVPFLDKIPFMGALFSRVYQTSTKSELIILMRPVVVTSPAMWNGELANIQSRYHELNEGFHMGPFPDRFGNLAETQYFNSLDQEHNVAEGDQTLSKAAAQACAGSQSSSGVKLPATATPEQGILAKRDETTGLWSCTSSTSA